MIIIRIRKTYIVRVAYGLLYLYKLGTIFAYGQTGTGKTFTMEGVQEIKELRGIIPNSFEHIFDSIALSSDKVTSPTKYVYLIYLIYLNLSHTFESLFSN